MFKGVILMISTNLLVLKRSIVDTVHTWLLGNIILRNVEVSLVFENVEFMLKGMIFIISMKLLVKEQFRGMLEYLYFDY